MQSVSFKPAPTTAHPTKTGKSVIRHSITDGTIRFIFFKHHKVTGSIAYFVPLVVMRCQIDKLRRVLAARCVLGGMTTEPTHNFAPLIFVTLAINLHTFPPKSFELIS